MKNKKHLNVYDFVRESFRLMRIRPVILMFILIALPIIYLIVYATGGIKFVYSHSMYIPIVLPGFIMGCFLVQSQVF